MNDDELKKLWQQQLLRAPELSATQMISAMQSKMTQFRRSLNGRDTRELLACALVIIIFGFYFYFERNPVVRLGWLIVISGTIFIAGKLVYARRTTPPAPLGATLVESLRAELNSVRAQSRLLGSILWWYLLPPGIGLLVATWGMHVHLHAKIPATLIYLAIYSFIYLLNQRARTKELLPMEAQLESLLHSAETGKPLEEKHVAHLHPIALSMTSGEQVKPVEFKVAFLQLAIYGEIGFVGMWFFGTLSRALDQAPFGDAIFRIFRWPSLIWVVPFFLGGLLFCWILQKGTERAVGITPFGIYLARGHVLFLWDEIKAVRIFRFLNIRSLWLIRESGEKAIMPWSSLERHAELKAAVERFAPANHPIRQYLSLLKRV